MALTHCNPTAARKRVLGQDVDALFCAYCGQPGTDDPSNVALARIVYRPIYPGPDWRHPLPVHVRCGDDWDARLIG